MRLKTIIMSMAVIGFLFASCDDGKKKEAEAQALAEEMRLEREADSLRVLEEVDMAKLTEMEANSIAARAMDSEDLSKLSDALEAANMTETLRAEGEYTVFAPVNDAFDKISKADFDNLMDPANQSELQSLLNYHVVSGLHLASDLMAKVKEGKGKYEVTTLNGEKLILSEKNGKLMVKDINGNVANVITSDIDASNGVIYTVDKVLMPKK